MKHKKIVACILAGSMLSLMVGCKEVNEVMDTVDDQVGNILHSDDKEVLFIKDASHVGNAEITYEKVFDDYFHNTTWNYFLGKNNEKVVEFTGYFRRDGNDLKFRMQFLLDENGETFQEGAMTVNDLQLSEFEKVYIMTALFINYADSHDISIEQQQEYNDGEQASGEDFASILSEYEAKKSNYTTSDVQNSTTVQNNWSNNQVQNNTVADDSDAYVEDDSAEEEYEDTDDGTVEEDYDAEDSDENTEEEDYIISYSDSCYLSDEDVEDFSKEELRLARNEIYARHGRKFKDKALQEYFDEKSWYEGEYEPDEFQETCLSLVERKNAAFLLAKEKGEK